jgi:hypothetical protein
MLPGTFTSSSFALHDCHIMSSLTAAPISGLEVNESNHGLRSARAAKKNTQTNSRIR